MVDKMEVSNFDTKLAAIAGGSLQQFYNEKTITLAAGARFTDFSVYDYFRVLSLTGSGLQIIFGDNQLQTPFTGAGVGLKLTNIVKRLELVNTSGVSINVTYATAIGQVSDDRLNVSGTVTVAGTVSTTTSSTLASIADVTLPAATLTAIVAANAARRGVIVTNIGANVARIGDNTTTTAARGAQLLPNQSITLETLNAIGGISTVGSSVSVLEY